MTDWKALAHARGLEIPASDLDRVVQPLDSLEKAFRPMVAHLAPELEPSLVYFPEEDAE